MFEFYVADMTCGHCVSAITQAVKEIEPEAKVDIDLNAHIVRVEGVDDAIRVREAISDAGYTPVPRN